MPWSSSLSFNPPCFPSPFQSGVHNPEIKHFKCKQCPKRYATRSGLTNHSANHSSLKCPTCDMGFNKQTTLQKHMFEFNHGTNDSSFKCPTCDMGFGQETILQKHMIEFNHFGNVADRSSFNEEELRKSLEEMAKSIGGGATLPPFPAGPVRSSASSKPSSTTSPSSRRGRESFPTANIGRPFARPFAQKNAFSRVGGERRPMPGSLSSSVGGRPFYRPFVGANRPTPFGRPFPKPFQRPVPRQDDDEEIEEVVLD